jgi:Protein of unknown function (DUF732)
LSGEVTPPRIAWGDELAEPRAGGRGVIAVAVQAMLALAIAAVAGVVLVMSARPRADHYSISPASVEQLAPKPTTPPRPPSPLPAGANQFVAALINRGAEVTDSNIAVHYAHWVCDFLGDGFTRREVAGAVRPKMRYAEAQAATFVDLSIDYYCPEYLA